LTEPGGKSDPEGESRGIFLRSKEEMACPRHLRGPDVTTMSRQSLWAGGSSHSYPRGERPEPCEPPLIL
jgi:hypothetical protein